jgi:hypothetical protein
MASKADPLQPGPGSRAPGVSRRFLAGLAVLVLIALALRVAAAQGALWLDEAWSAVFARDAATPADVFLAINHDNNHFANTLWLQATGWGAPPLMSRALSIFSGTLAVAVGGMIGLRRSPAAGLATAALLAVSPILVIYGSEARGYAPMLLALLAAVAVVDRWLFVAPFRSAPFLLGAVAAFGMISHLTMLFGLVAVAGWIAETLMRRMPPLRALAETMKVMRWAFAAVLAVLAMISVVALGNAGYRIGSVWPFSPSAFIGAVGEMLGYSLGWQKAPAGPTIVAALILLALALWRLPALRDRAAFYVLAIVLLPAAVFLLRLENSGFPRYFLVTALALLLFVGDLLGAGLQRARLFRWAATAALIAVCAASLLLDRALILDRRGDPGDAITAMRLHAADGATAAVGNPRSSAVLASAAASAGYRLHFAERPCPPAPFLYVDEDGWAPMPERLMRCGVGYRVVATRSFIGLSGLTWTLYGREGR